MYGTIDVTKVKDAQEIRNTVHFILESQPELPSKDLVSVLEKIFPAHDSETLTKLVRVWRGR